MLRPGGRGLRITGKRGMLVLQRCGSKAQSPKRPKLKEGSYDTRQKKKKAVRPTATRRGILHSGNSCRGKSSSSPAADRDPLSRAAKPSLVAISSTACFAWTLFPHRQGATAVRSAAAIHHPVATLEQTLAQRSSKVPSPKDTQQLLLRGSCGAQGTQQHALWLHLLRHAAVNRHGHSLTQTRSRIAPVFRVEVNRGPSDLSNTKPYDCYSTRCPEAPERNIYLVNPAIAQALVIDETQECISGSSNCGSASYKLSHKAAVLAEQILLKASCVSTMGKSASKQFSDEVLQCHNEFRRTHQASSLKLSSKLSKEATRYAESLASTRILKHSAESSRGNFGENLAWASYDQSGKDVTDRWYDEVKQYNFNRPGFSSGTGHFTAMVWKSSNKLGR
ncbi:hypothetical protein F7725_018526 [Dissostichus mawsoni]|uniref:Golgi-associated plant pathogenesis-related protein 1 n=1 Tax=Dissostichus mawsoni TaxID=36200 RepID=A0A7J5XTB9_DISMA|nr:hypothetical protein F7725_018526 [Dissostichus mawsoni]